MIAQRQIVAQRSDAVADTKLEPRLGGAVTTTSSQHSKVVNLMAAYREEFLFDMLDHNLTEEFHGDLPDRHINRCSAHKASSITVRDCC